FLEHTYRWLKAKGVLVFVLPRPRLDACARLLSEQFVDLRIYRLTEPESIQFQQIVILGLRKHRHVHTDDAFLLRSIERLRRVAVGESIVVLTDIPDAVYTVPSSTQAALVNQGIPLDAVEDQLPQSAAYRQASRVLIREQHCHRGRPLTP